MRNEFNEADKKRLRESSDLIKSFTDFGLEVWTKRLKEYKNDTHDLPPNLLFRQILEAGDAIVELVNLGCINASKPLLRMALDCYLQLAFLLEKDKEKRALHFLYHYNRNRFYYLERILNPDSKNSVATKLAGDNIMNKISLTKEEMEMALTDYNTLKEILNSDENVEVAKEYGTRRKQTWYHTLIGSPKIEDLAKSLKRNAMYEIIFRNLSSFIHGEDIIHSNVIFYPDEIIGIKNLRDATQLDFVVNNSIIIVRKSILLFIDIQLEADINLISILRTIDDKRKSSTEKK